MEIEQKIDEVAKTFADFKKLNDERIKAIESKGFAPADLVEKTEKANGEISRLQEEIKSLQTAMARNPHGGGDDEEKADAEAKARKDAFNKFCRKGAARLTEVEMKAMSVDSDVDGGFLVTPELSSEIVKKVFESSPIRQFASVQGISTDSLEIIEDLDESEANWVGETQTRAETDTPEIKKIIIPVHELEAKPKATQKILDDAAWNVEAWLADKVSEKFGRKEATAFVSGDGMSKPKGILSYAAGTSFGQVEQVNSGSAATITADGLIDLQAALKEAYQSNARFMMKRLTEAAVRKLKDSQGRYLWEPSLVPGNPNMLLGKPLHHADDVQALGAGNLSVIYGDFKAGYQIVDRIGIRVIRDIYSAKPYVEFYTTKRVGGGVKNFEALKIQKCST